MAMRPIRREEDRLPTDTARSWSTQQGDVDGDATDQTRRGQVAHRHRTELEHAARRCGWRCDRSDAKRTGCPQTPHGVGARSKAMWMAMRPIRREEDRLPTDTARSWSTQQ